MNSVFAAECRWLGRAISGVILLFAVAHLVSGGAPNLAEAPPGERALFFWFALALAGLALLWKREVAGATISLVSGAGFYATELALSGRLPSGWFLLLFFAPGFLVLAAQWLESRRSAA